MTVLLVKLLVTPAFIVAATLTAQRWGPAVGGWLVGLPLTAGPVAVFLAVDHGAEFAAAAAVGTLGGAVTQSAYAVAYSRVAVRSARIVPALAAGLAAFVATFGLLAAAGLGLAVAAPCAALIPLVGVRLMPRGVEASRAALPVLPRWEVAVRAAVTTALVLVLTTVAPRLGTQLTGLLSAVPLFGGVLAVFSQARDGPRAAVSVLRGLLVGLLSFTTFFVVLAVALPRIPIGVAFAAAVAGALAVEGVSLLAVRPASGAASAGSALTGLAG